MPRHVRISGTSGDDILTGQGFAEYHIDGGAGNDKLTGGSFDDDLIGGPGADWLDGGAGFDIASYAGSASGVKVNLATGLGAGGEAKGDILTGIEGVGGSHFADTLIGDAQDNWFLGGGGGDHIDGGSGSDTAVYVNSPAGVSIDLSAGTASGGDAQGDQLTSIENIFGTHHDDTIVGDAGANVLDGRSGDDMLFGGGGSDTLAGGHGDDTLEGGAGADMISGSVGIDMASYASSGAGVKVNLMTGQGIGGHAQGDLLSGIDNLTGSAFSDVLTGTNEDNVIHGGNGNDTIRAGAGVDQLLGGAGDDHFVFLQGDQPTSASGSNYEWIGDFAAGGSEDLMDLTNAGTGFMSLGDVLAHSIEVQANGQVGTLIDLGPSGQVYLADVRMADFTSSDFIFV